MIYAIVLLSAFSLFSSTMLLLSIRKNLQFVELIEDFFEETEESIKILEFHLSKIEKKSKLEIMLDDPIIRELVDDIKKSKEAVQLVKDKMSTIVEESE
jgi:hypothetical protein